MNKNVRELFDLTGRTAIVTGGSRGLGREIAEGLAEAGANLVLCARRAEWLDETVREFKARGFAVVGKTCDVSNADEVQAVIEHGFEAFGQINILVNNAGTSWEQCPRTCRSSNGRRLST